ncbi:MAG TPA: imidazole glycerol phosphate synthase subunit HisH [Elusimicrobiota bacterium]|nr:imidazole glycerol phosphate synthase subunit HisH [Elusimicrobiota bacterium]
MKRKIAVVDYGMGNLRSVEKALQKVGGRASVTDSARVLRQADAVVLPGVGSFGEAVIRLQKQKLWAPLEDALAKGKPFLGICLGLQLLLERSEESPGAKGFGFFRGVVRRFQSTKRRPLKIPHIGWNTLRLRDAASPWLDGVRSNHYFYFVHSYYPDPLEKSSIAAVSHYGGPFCAAMSAGQLFASQFHPEKSGALGLRILKNFAHRLDAA